jgi:putative transcriptional regulator
MTPSLRSGGPVRSDSPDGGSAGERVRSRRKELAITQQEMSAQVGVSRQTVISMETGDYAPSVYLALKVAKLLDTSVEALWGTNLS